MTQKRILNLRKSISHAPRRALCKCILTCPLLSTYQRTEVTLERKGWVQGRRHLCSGRGTEEAEVAALGVGGGKKSFSCSCSAFSTNCGYVWHIPSKSRRLWGPILKNLRKTDDVLQTGCCRGYSDPVRGGWSQLAPFHCGRTSLPGDKPATVLGRALHSASAPMFFQEKEIYRWPARESLKTMLAVGWTVERTKEGEALFQQRENEKLRSVSQASQV